jgi:hypothetical protein
MGRIIFEMHRGATHNLPPILERLSLNHDAWYQLTTTFEKQFKQVGSGYISYGDPIRTSNTNEYRRPHAIEPRS